MRRNAKAKHDFLRPSKKIACYRPWLEAMEQRVTPSGDFGFALRIGNPVTEEVHGIATDPAGNVCMTGSLYGTVDFDPGPGTYNLSSDGDGYYDTFVAKYSGSGALLWARAFGGSNYFVRKGVAVDGAGNVYTTGVFYGTVDLDPGPATFTLTSNGLADVFVSKLDAAGNFVWAKAFGGSSAADEIARGVAVDAAGNVYTTGLFWGTADFDPGVGTFNLTSSGTSDIFVSKLNSAGGFVWARAMGGSALESPGIPADDVFGIAVDAAGNVHTTGQFTGTADFDPGVGSFPLTAISAFSDMFVSKLDTTGAFIWARAMGGTSIKESRGIALDGMGNVYTTGYFGAAVDFDPGPAAFSLSTGSYAQFVLKLNATGAFAWARKIGGSSPSSAQGYDIAVDGANNVHTTGTFVGTVDFDPGPGTFNIASAGFSNDAFVSKLDTTGAFVWTKAISGGASAEIGQSIAVDTVSNVYSAGQFTGTTDFDPGPATFNLTPIGIDVFLSKLLGPNQSPTDITLSNNTIAENAGTNALVGVLAGVDLDAGETFTFTLVAGAGDADNGQFYISDNQLRANVSFDFEAGTNTKSVRVRVIDGASNTFEKSFTINVTNVNEAPADIALSTNSVAENQPTATTVGAFSSTDPDLGDSFTYTLVSGAGDTGNGSFIIDLGGNLKTAASFNFEAQSTYSIRVRSTDFGGLPVDKVFTINVTNVNETPTNMALSNNSVAENQTTGTAVGAFSTTDPDVGDSFTYALVSGTGDTGNASFTIDAGGNLKTAASFDFETQTSYSIRVRSTDSGGLSTEKVFVISVTNVNEAPADVALSNSSVPENQAAGTIVGVFSTSDPDVGDSFTYTLISGAGDSGNCCFTVDAAGNLKTATSFDFESQSSYSIRVRSTDAGGLAIEKAFAISVMDVNEAPAFTSVPPAQQAFEDVDKSIGGILVDDPEGGSVTVNLGVLHGKLTVVPGGGVVIAGNGTGSVSLYGSIAALNGVLGTLVYRGHLNFSGNDMLSLSVSDGSLSTTADVGINVKSAADQAADLRALILALRAAGVLNKGQANSLLVKLDLKGTNGDIGKVQALLNEITAFAEAGTLSQAQANSLLVPGNVLLLSVSRR